MDEKGRGSFLLALAALEAEEAAEDGGRVSAEGTVQTDQRLSAEPHTRAAPRHR